MSTASSLCTFVSPSEPSHLIINPTRQYYILVTEFEISSSGDSYTATGFDLTKQQPSLKEPLGNPTYNPSSPYLRWIQYLTVNYNDSKIETYNFAVHGATVDKSLLDRGSSLSTQVEKKFLPNYDRHGNHAGGDEIKRRSRGRESKRSSNNGGRLANWEPDTTLFSVWFGINDNVFSNKSEVLFDEIFESYNRTLYQVRSHRRIRFLWFSPCLHTTLTSIVAAHQLSVSLSSTPQARKTSSS